MTKAYSILAYSHMCPHTRYVFVPYILTLVRGLSRLEWLVAVLSGSATSLSHYSRFSTLHPSCPPPSQRPCSTLLFVDFFAFRLTFLSFTILFFLVKKKNLFLTFHLASISSSVIPFKRDFFLGLLAAKRNEELLCRASPRYF